MTSKQEMRLVISQIFVAAGLTGVTGWKEIVLLLFATLWFVSAMVES